MSLKVRAAAVLATFLISVTGAGIASAQTQHHTPPKAPAHAPTQPGKPGHKVSKKEQEHARKVERARLDVARARVALAEARKHGRPPMIEKRTRALHQAEMVLKRLLGR